MHDSPLPAYRISQFHQTLGPLPTLDALRPNLELQTVNTGRQFNTPPAPYGAVMNDMEALHALADEHGHIMLTSGVEMPMTMYRGQTQEHQPCVPSLARLPHARNQLLALGRSVAFAEAIGAHPYVAYCAQARLFDAPLSIDKQGLAQHYGLSTDLLDVTSNFDVASFFATCQWDTDRSSFQPVTFSAQPGVLYRFTPHFFDGQNQSAEFKHVGWQPLQRPEQQRACAMLMKKGHDFESLPTVQKVRFRHSAKVSMRIWKSFDEGRALFPADAAAELAEQAKCLTVFTRSQLDQAWTKLDAWHGVTTEFADRQAIETTASLTVADSPVLTWDGLNIATDVDQMRAQLESVLGQVRCRMARYL